MLFSAATDPVVSGAFFMKVKTISHRPHQDPSPLTPSSAVLAEVGHAINTFVVAPESFHLGGLPDNAGRRVLHRNGGPGMEATANALIA